MCSNSIKSTDCITATRNIDSVLTSQHHFMSSHFRTDSQIKEINSTLSNVRCGFFFGFATVKLKTNITALDKY